MSFRKRNVGINPSSSNSPRALSSLPVRETRDHLAKPASEQISHSPGVRPSPLDGRLTTSTGTPSLDELLAGHGGLALGTSILLEESGTTDYVGILLKYYAAEGLVQGHTVHVLGVGEQWSRELPGFVGGDGAQEKKAVPSADAGAKMKIAWRYEKLARSGAEVTGSRAHAVLANEKGAVASGPSPGGPAATTVFCHMFDLTKRLAITSASKIRFIPLSAGSPDRSPYAQALQKIYSSVSTSDAGSIHRIVIPMLLSPAIYPPHACHPHHLLQFLHGLRGMLRQSPNRTTAMISLPLDLYPRSAGLVRWMELLSDGVMELTPFPHLSHDEVSPAPGSASSGHGDQPQGMFQIHTLPVFHEKGGGGGGGHNAGDDLAFTVSRKKFVIKPFNLPPVDGDDGAARTSEDKTKKVDIDF